MANEKLWAQADRVIRAEKSGKLGSVARQRVGLGSELKHAAKFTASYWKNKLGGSSRRPAVTRDTLGKGTRSQLEKLDSF
ncbi:MAG: hypothetical protein MN733_36595 [Nitrososphaera sp.]|nr:hypothetical protein [Nitrososphaera sp.]